MRFTRVLPPPGWSVWSLGGAGLVGLVLPSVLAALVTLAGYYPIGSALPNSPFWSATGAIAVIFCVGTVILAAAPVYSLLAWSWRPLVLALIFGIAGIAGIVPSVIGAQYLRFWAFELVSNRSAELVSAIEKYTSATGTPPATLAELVPKYLPSIPTTGMAAEPEYRYASHGGACTGESRWHLSVSVSQFIDMNQLLYCPAGDYANTVIYPVLSRSQVGTWVHEEMAF